MLAPARGQRDQRSFLLQRAQRQMLERGFMTVACMSVRHLTSLELTGLCPG